MASVAHFLSYMQSEMSETWAVNSGLNENNHVHVYEKKSLKIAIITNKEQENVSMEHGCPGC